MNDYIGKRLIEQVSGELTEKVRIQGKKNRLDDYFFIGQLSPQVEDISDESRQYESRSKVSQLGIEYLTDEKSSKESSVGVEVTGKLFYRIYPTLEEQREHWLSSYNEKNDSTIKSFSELSSSESTRKINKHTCDVSKVYQSRKYELKGKYGFKGSPPEEDEISINDNGIDVLQEEISNDPNFYARIREKVKYSDLKDENSWKGFIEEHKREKLPLGWGFMLSLTRRKAGDGKYSFSVKFRNNTNEPNDDRIYSPEIFNVKLKINLESFELFPIVLKEFAEDYKYDRKVFGVGINCDVVEKRDDKTLETSTIPVHKQYKLKTRTHDLNLEFDELASKPIPLLQSLLKLMSEDFANFDLSVDEYLKRTGKNATEQGRKQIQVEKKSYELEIDRFELGIKVLGKYENAQRAFRLMNESFSKQNKAYSSWRLFQLVYIVSALTDFVKNEHPEIESTSYSDVDLIYFPTGGGKTEAFLGLIVFNLFFDRIRGKEFGTSGFVKYPLRLLSIQQTQRIADVIAAAEKIRRFEKDIAKTTPFSIGYLVGEGNTPNKIDWERAKFFLEAGPEYLTSKYKILIKCPFCGSPSLQVQYLHDSKRLVHACSDCDEGILPIYIVDRELFRYLPSVIVSTIDKFTAIGFQRNFRTLLGVVSGKCDIHGYSSSTQCTAGGPKCSESGAFKLKEVSDIAPSFMIQDELHMLVESLGVYDAHYETFINKYVNELSPGEKNHLKVICATATLSNFENQIWHLFLKDAVRFPSPSVDPEKSFYYEISEEVGRVFYGLAPIGVSPKMAVQELAKYQRLILSNLLDDEELFSNILGRKVDASERTEIIKKYWLVLEYGLKKNDAIDICDTLTKTINSELNDRDQFVTENLTGDRSLDEVIKIVDQIENSEEPLPRPDFIASTSMISHGVDIELFNFMLMLSVPQTMGEYIQASSRAGRSFPANIFMVFLSNREKDKSYYRHFVKFNELKDILIEPVAIDRWVHNAILRSLPGILWGFIFQYFDLKKILKGGETLIKLDSLKEELNEKKDITPEMLIELISSSYGVKFSSSELHYQRIRDAVETFFERVPKRSLEKNKFITTVLPDFRPMTSLRDTDETLEIYHDKVGEDRTMRRGRVQSLYKHFPGSWINFRSGPVDSVCQVIKWKSLEVQDNQINKKRVFQRVNKALIGFGGRNDDFPESLTQHNAAILDPKRIIAGDGSSTYFCANKGCRRVYTFAQIGAEKKCLNPKCGRKTVQMPLIYYCDCGQSTPVKLVKCSNSEHGYNHMKFIESGGRRIFACGHKDCDYVWSLYTKKCPKCQPSKLMKLSNIGGTKVSISRTISFIDLIDSEEEQVLDIEGGKGYDAIFGKYVGLIENDSQYESIIQSLNDPTEVGSKEAELEKELQLVMAQIPDKAMALDLLKKLKPELFQGGEEDLTILNEVEKSLRMGEPDRDAHAVCILERKTIDTYENKLTIAGAKLKSNDFKLKREKIDYNEILSSFKIDDIVASEDINMVLTLYGYSREHHNIPRSVLNPFRADDLMSMDSRLQDKIPIYLLKYKTEGIVLDFNRKKIIDWCLENEFIDEFRDNLPKDLNDQTAIDLWWLNNFSPSMIEFFKGIEPEQSPFTYYCYSLLHTISHSLLRNVETVSGLSRGSLSEYLMPTTGSLMIYTHDTHENPLGVFESIMINSLDHLMNAAKISLIDCINDPLCMDYMDDKRVTASCFDCCYTSEVSCQHMNFDLDRRLVIGGKLRSGKKIKGFWEK